MLSYTFYNDKIPGSFAGRDVGPFIFIKPAYKDDVGLHNHEDQHATQWWIPTFIGFLISIIVYTHPQLRAYQPYWFLSSILGMGVHPFLYTYFWQYRLWAEVQCYRVQAKSYPDDRRKLFANFVFTKYDLAKYITEEEVYKKMIA